MLTRSLNLLRLKHHRTWTSLTRTPESLIIHSLNNTPFPYIWLRDSCQSPKSINPNTGHKLHCTSDIPLDIAPIDQPSGVKVTNSGIEIDWNDGNKSAFSQQWLRTYLSPSVEENFHWDDTFKIIPWTRASIENSSSTLTGFPYEPFMSSDKVFLNAMEDLAKYGLVFVRGVPTDRTSDDDCELKRLADRVGEIRKTFYGLFWDVVKLKDGKNVAYTDLALRLHMDVLYYEHPPRYQILHCLRNKAIGGTSIAIDGVFAAQRLRETHPADFDVLTKTPVTFHYIHDGHHVHQNHPTIVLAPPSSSSHREISHLNYSPPEQGPLPLSTPKEFYPALKRFTDLLKDEEYLLKYDLAEGDAVIFDNRRLIHGRTAFRYMTDEERLKTGRSVDDGEPDRWLKGCYLGADAVLDRVRNLKTRFTTGKPSLEYVGY